MDSDQKFTLNMMRSLAGIKIEEVKLIIAFVQHLTGEQDMTADFIWGNCSLDQLMETLENDKTN